MKLNDLMNMWGRSASAGLSSLESYLHNKFNQVGQNLQKQIPQYNPQSENPVVKSALTAVAPGVSAFIQGGFKGYANQMATAKAPSPETLVMGFMGGGFDENVAAGLEGISEDLLPLAKEALKYDSAEEFRQAYNNAYKKGLLNNKSNYMDKKVGIKFGKTTIDILKEGILNDIGFENFYNQSKNLIK